MKKTNLLLPIILIALLLGMLSCQSSSDIVFPKLGYRYFDKFIHDDYDGKLYIQEDHEGDAILPTRMFFLFGDMNDTFAGRMNMGPLYLDGNTIEQVYDVWAAPLSGPVSGRVNHLKLYTSSNELIVEENLYFPKNIEAIIPDTIRIGELINWNKDEKNEHGVLIELSLENDTTLSFDELGENRSYFYFPQDDGQIKLTSEMLQTLDVKHGDYKRLRIYRGNFDKIHTKVEYPKDIKFMYWSAVYKLVYFDLD